MFCIRIFLTGQWRGLIERDSPPRADPARDVRRVFRIMKPCEISRIVSDMASQLLSSNLWSQIELTIACQRKLSFMYLHFGMANITVLTSMYFV